MSDPQPPDDPLIAAWIGPNWRRHYRDSFAAGASGGRFHFNWAAALVPFWLTWRKQWLAQLVVVLLFIGLGAVVTNDSFTPLMTITVGLVCAVQGFRADALLQWQAARAATVARASGVDAEAHRSAMRRAGGVSPFGVGVLMVPVLLLGYQLMMTDHMAPGKPAIAMMKSDLRNLVSAEESYFADFSVYTANLPLQPNGQPYFAASAGVTVTMGPATATGWSATASHTMTSRTCAVFVGSADPPLAGSNEGEPRCDTAAAPPR